VCVSPSSLLIVVMMDLCCLWIRILVSGR
jgi:hypothetical protein